MTRAEAEKIIAALVTLRESATDEQALKVPSLYPAWKPGMDCKAGDRVQHRGALYKVLQAHTSQDTWTPDASPSLYAKVLIPDETVIHEWEQPDSTNAYSKGDKVTHNGKTWVSDVDNNVWEPGVYGWSESTQPKKCDELKG